MTGAERIAAHVLAAGPGGGVRAARALREAAAAAWARGAPESAVVYLKRAAEEQLPRGELVPLLRELARALIATEGPGGFPVLREALALATGSEREEIVLELGRALMVQGYFSDAAAVFAPRRERGGAHRAGDRQRARSRAGPRAPAGSTRWPSSCRSARPPSAPGSRWRARRPRAAAPTTPSRPSRTRGRPRSRAR